MYYVLIAKDAPVEEICGITDDEAYALWWVSEEAGGLGPKRIYKSFELGVISPSCIEHRFESNSCQ